MRRIKRDTVAGELVREAKRTLQALREAVIALDDLAALLDDVDGECSSDYPAIQTRADKALTAVQPVLAAILDEQGGFTDALDLISDNHVRASRSR